MITRQFTDWWLFWGLDGVCYNNIVVYYTQVG